MSTTEDTMSSDRAPPERPEPPADAQDETIETERHDPLSGITTDPGSRYTDDVPMLVVEAELACLEGKQLDNPAKIPEHADGTAERFAEALENHEEDLVPAWTRPWEVDDDE
jgi:hypothetical protein